jgi:hypothetical protein
LLQAEGIGNADTKAASLTHRKELGRSGVSLFIQNKNQSTSRGVNEIGTHKVSSRGVMQ